MEMHLGQELQHRLRSDGGLGRAWVSRCNLDVYVCVGGQNIKISRRNETLVKQGV